MSVKFQLIHQQWDEIRKALKATQKKFTNNCDLSLTNCISNKSQDQVRKNGIMSDNDVDFFGDNQNQVLLLKDTIRSTRRKFYLSQRRRELSFQNDQEFYSQLQSRREQAQKQKILYSNVVNFEKAIKQITTPKITFYRPKTRIQQNCQDSLTPMNQSGHQRQINNYFADAKQNSGDRKSDRKTQSFWQNLKAQDKKDSNITQILRKRFKRKNDLSLEICSFNYESLSLLNQQKSPSYQ